MGAKCCVIQDLQTRNVIGHGTEKDALYYVEEVSQKGYAILARGSVEQQLWKWHRRLGDPSLEYLEHLFPSLRGSKLILIVSHVFWQKATNIGIIQSF